MGTRGLAGAAMAGLLCGGVAQAADLKPAPDYFTETIVATTTAQNVALACPYLSFDLDKAAAVSDRVLAQLGEDGFDAKTLESTMEDPAPTIRAMQQAFLDKHALPREGAAFEDVCAAGQAEMEEATAIGGFLIEITGEGAVDPTKDDATGAD